MTIKTIAMKILSIGGEWAALIGMTMLICWVDGFWPTLGLMWLTCVMASATGMLRALISGKVILATSVPTATPEPGRDDCDDFILSDAE